MSEKMAIYERMMQANANDDPETFLSYLTDDIEYHYHMTTRPLLGKEWVRKFLTNYKEICADVEWRVDRHAESDDCLFVEGYEEYTDLRTGQRVAHPYMGIMEFRGKQICKWRDYFEMNNPKQNQAAST